MSETNNDSELHCEKCGSPGAKRRRATNAAADAYLCDGCFGLFIGGR